MTFISWRNWIGAATLAASAEIASLPVDRVKIPKLSNRYRVADLSAGASRTRVDGDFGQARGLDIAVWARPRRRAIDEEEEAPSFAAGDLVRHTLSSGDDYSDDVYDSADMASNIALGYGYHGHLYPSTQSARYFSFEFDALSRTVSPDNYVDWGYAHYGLIDLEPEIDFAAPMARSFREGAVRRFSDDGGTMTIRRKKSRRRFDLVFRSLKTAELAAVEAFLEYAGDGGIFLMGVDRDDLARGLVFGVLDEARYDRTSRKFSGMSLPVLEAV